MTGQHFVLDLMLCSTFPRLFCRRGGGQNHTRAGRFGSDQRGSEADHGG